MTRRLAEVARHVGVSQATVSRVLNDRPGIAPATRSAVLTALDVLGYERPAKLRGDRARLVGLVLPELQNPIYPALAEVLAGVLAQRGLTPVLCPQTVNGSAEADHLRMLIEQQVAGVILASGAYQVTTAAHDHYALLRERGLPVVLINGSVEGLGLPRVSTDEEHGIEQAYRHLAALGHQRIGIIAGPHNHVLSVRRIAALRRLHPEPRLVAYAGSSIEEGYAAAGDLLAAGATAVLCGGDDLAIGTIRAARRLGLAVPTDVSVIGHDDSTLMTYTDPPLTTIRQPVAPMGQAAVALLLRQLDGEPTTDDELLFEPELVVRASTAPAPSAAR